MTTRRAFIRTLAGALLAAPLASEAQQTGRMYRIGYLFESAPPDQISPQLRAIEEDLRGLGYVEGRNLVVERRYAAFKYALLPDLAAELVRLKPDVIVTAGNPSIAALKQATTTVPIVMAWAIDPVGAGLVASLARPGGNITGSSLSTGPQLQLVGVRGPDEFDRTFSAMTRERAEALIVFPSAMLFNERKRIVSLATKQRLPSMFAAREFVELGGLMSYGASITDLIRRSATYVDKILKGAKPADLPVEQPTKFELVINLKTAKALGLTIPPSLLARADEVIQ